MKLGIRTLCFAMVGLAMTVVHAPSLAQSGTIKIGMTAALTGYLASVDRTYADGALLAVEKINGEGGIGGRKLELIIEDMRSEPKDAVAAATKLIDSDKVDVFVVGCSSAGGLAQAPIVARAGVAMVTCALLPKPDSADYAWVYSTRGPIAGEVTPRIDYLASTKVTKIGILFDATPFSRALNEETEKAAAQKGMTIVGSEQFQMTNTDLSVNLKKLVAAGAQAIIKNGVGPSTVISAKNMYDLGLKEPMLTVIDVMTVNRDASTTLPNQTFFVAPPLQVYEALPANSAFRAPIGEFMKYWKPKYGDRDPTWAGPAWDGILIVAEAIKRAGSTDKVKVRDAINGLSSFTGTNGVYSFSTEIHYGIRQIPTSLARFTGGKLEIVR